jgi:hypothetical protein
MFRIDDATAATSLPAPEASGTEGYFTEGNPVAGTPATNVRGSWLNMIQEELCAILAAAGITRSKTSYNQVNGALQKMYSPVVGTVRNLVMSVTAASATATLTADQIVVASALNGQTYILPNFSKTINLATTGAGGMDTGTAPVSGYVALYAIYNPTTGVSALLATNATAATAPNVYGGANMPAGYTASALVSVWPTNASSQFAIGAQVDRWVSIVPVVVIAVTTAQASTTSFSIAAAAPKNARSIAGYGACTNGASPGNNSLFLYSSAQQLCTRQIGANLASTTGGVPTGIPRMPVLTAQTLYYTSSSNSSFAANFAITDYEF